MLKACPCRDVRNGLALCKNAHWAFAAGLWSLDGGDAGRG
ncbi:MAG: hypothetical protein DWI22_18075 [Planctomycetota bacterium]|nr:MAG: hypothetical protein DWI22_18075 [Planctomycetota bacterium]